MTKFCQILHMPPDLRLEVASRLSHRFDVETFDSEDTD